MDNPALTTALALATGMIAQSLARHLKTPGIVLLLAVGVLLGPDVAGIIQPASLGSALPLLVGFAVAVILFEGGMNLRIARIRREGRVIRRLITLGALVTAAGGALVANVFLGWGWRLSVLFGTLVTITGPTVITPLLRRIKVKKSMATVLKAEGVLLDAIGAIVAVVALEIAISPSGGTFVKGLLHIVVRLGFGSLSGLIGGLVLAMLLRFRNLVPEGLENVFTLTLVFALFQGSNAFMPESGIVAVAVAGLVVGNVKTVVHRELRVFEEQLTVMLIGMLFVLLAADVRLADVRVMGVGGALTVAALILVVRPLNVLISTRRSDLNSRQKLFLSWIAPRGIVAAAVASLFAIELDRRGFNGGQLRAMVFLVIAVTVVLSGLTGGLAAHLLGLRRPSGTGWVILGLNEVGRALARSLHDGGEEVICIDANPKACQRAEEDGLKVIYGNGLEERSLHRAEIDTRAGAVGLTPNEEVNLLFVQKAKEVGKVPRLLVAIKSGEEGITTEMVHEFGGVVLFGRARDLDLWSVRLRRGIAELERRSLSGKEQALKKDHPPEGKETVGLLVPMVLCRDNRVSPVDDKIRFKEGDEVMFMVNRRRNDEALQWFKRHRWSLVQTTRSSRNKPLQRTTGLAVGRNRGV